MSNVGSNLDRRPLGRKETGRRHEAVTRGFKVTLYTFDYNGDVDYNGLAS